MARYLVEPAKRLGVCDSVDVVVVGGGIGGVATAVAAARNGASVCLVEKSCSLGGLATIGNVIIYLPLCDGKGNQVIKGLGEELLRLSIRDGYDQIPACWQEGGDIQQRCKERLRVDFNPCSYMIALEELIAQSGVGLLYDTRFCDVQKKGNLVTAVIVESKSGRQAIRCKAVVDASGDADVCHVAGEATESLNTNVRAGWYYYFDGQQVRVRKLSDKFDSQALCVPDGQRGYAGDNVRDVTDQMLDTRSLVAKDLQKLAADLGRPVSPVMLATTPCFRMTRRLRADVELATCDDHRWFDDAVGMTGDWRKAGPVYCIPYRSLVGVKTDNLLAVGRCMSSATDLWDATRVIPTCAVTGEAAGTACALAIRHAKGRLSHLKISQLQDQLRKQGVLIDRHLAGA